MRTTEPLASNNYIATINTLGHAVLIETLKMAAYYLSHSNGLEHRGINFKATIKEAKSCYVFVQGTGLDVTLNTFGLNYNAGRIKELFNYMARQSI